MGLTTAFGPSEGDAEVILRMTVRNSGSTTLEPVAGLASAVIGRGLRSCTRPSHRLAVEPPGGGGIGGTEGGFACASSACRQAGPARDRAQATLSRTRKGRAGSIRIS